MRNLRLYVLLAVVLLLIVVPVSAQQNTIITLGVPSWMESMVYSDDELLAEFQQLHPDVDVQIVPLNDIYDIPSLTEEADGYYEAMQEFASRADVLFVSGDMLTPVMTTAGYLLNLQPLVDTDPNFDSADYYTPAINMYRWDRGLWAIPMRYEMNTLLYNPARFDAMGLTYPSPSWTVDDFVNAVRTLTEYDASGEVSQSALIFSNDELVLLARSFVSEGFYDNTVLPNAPRFNTPELEYVIETLNTLRDDGLVNALNGDYENIAMMFAPAWVANSIRFAPDSDVEFRATLLPGNTSLPYVEGMAVSAGTAYPELAYDLARTFAEAFQQNYVSLAPRRSANQELLTRMPDLTPELRQTIEQGLENALPYSELRFSRYLNDVFTLMDEDDLSAGEALEALTVQAQADLDDALARANSTNIVVQQPELPPELAPGEIALRFGMNMSADEIINVDAWQAVADQFAADHPEVGYVDLVTRWLSEEELADMDCFFRPYNDIPFLDQSSLNIINIDPFLDADPNFDRSDLMNGVLSQVQRDGMTWGLPLTIRPTVLQYQIAPFEEAGLPLPQNDWTGPVFAETMRALSGSLEEGDYPYLFGSDVMNVLFLVATFDGLPYDLTTSPYELHFTDPESVQAIRQVLDLAIDGVIAYLPIFSTERSDFPVNNVYMYDTTFSAGAYRYIQSIEEEGMESGFVLFPQGQSVDPVRYDVSVGMITATTTHAELCYDWLMTLAHTTDLFYEMPVFNSVINDPVLDVAQSPELAAMYRQFAQVMNRPTSFVFSNGAIGDYAGFIEVLWLGRVFDDYVEEAGNIDLEARLAEAETHIEDFRACAAQIEPIDWVTATPEEAEAQIELFRNCALQTDPEWEDPFASRRIGG